MTAPLITARELAAQLGISTGALLRWTRAGQVPAVKLPSGAIRYFPEEIDRWLEARSMASDATRGSVTSPGRHPPPGSILGPVTSPAATRRSNNPGGTHGRT